MDDFLHRLVPHLPGVNVRAAKTVEDLLAACRTVIMAITSQKPVLPEAPQRMGLGRPLAL